MVTISIGRENLTIKLEGAKKLLAVKSSIAIPLQNITEVSTEQVKPIWLPAVRIGTHVPGAFMAGTFWLRKGGKTFYFVRDFTKCLTLTLKHHEYSQIIVEVGNDKVAIASGIKEALHKLP